jgi:ABC-type lipoprotein export system ATPase subunit
LLLPLRNVSGPLKEALDSKHGGTCQWILENSKYTQWLSPGKSGALCLTGQPGSGKSTLLASIFQKIDDDTDDDKVIVQYMSCDMTSAESGDKSPQSLARITGTLVFQLYERATLDENNPGLLEACNKVFSNPKQDRASQSGHASKKNPDTQDKTPKPISAGRKDVDLPDFVDALRQLSMHLKADVVIAVDAIDRMSSQDQTAFAESLARLETEDAQTCVRIVVASRTNPFASSDNVIDVGKYNYEDIGAKLQADLEGIKSLSQQEVVEAKEKIRSEAGYVYIFAPMGHIVPARDGCVPQLWAHIRRFTLTDCSKFGLQIRGPSRSAFHEGTIPAPNIRASQNSAQRHQ